MTIKTPNFMGPEKNPEDSHVISEEELVCGRTKRMT